MSETTPRDILTILAKGTTLQHDPDGSILTVGGIPYSNVYSAFHQYASNLNAIVSSELELHVDSEIITLDQPGKFGLVAIGLPRTTGPTGSTPMGARYINHRPISDTMTSLPARAFDTLPNEPGYARGITWLAKVLLALQAES